MMDAAEDLDRRERYLDVSGPRNWMDGEVARWLLALCLRRDGRVDAVLRADEILTEPRLAVSMADLHARERGAFASAMYVAWSRFSWPIHRIGYAFGCSQDFNWVSEVIAATASDIAASSPFRDGLTDICLAVREAKLEHEGAAWR